MKENQIGFKRPSYFLYLTLIVCIGFLSGNIQSQGLQAELSFNNDYGQFPTDMVCEGDDSYVLYYQYTSSFFTPSPLAKVNGLGEIEWEMYINPGVFLETIWAKELLWTDDNHLIVLGEGIETCDAGGFVTFMQKISPEGFIMWTRLWYDLPCCDAFSALSMTDEGEVSFLANDFVGGGAIISFDMEGNTTDSLVITESNLTEMIAEPSNYMIGYKDNLLMRFSPSGTMVDNIDFGNNITGIVKLDDNLWLLTDNALHMLDENLESAVSMQIGGYGSFSNLKLNEDQIQFVGKQTGITNILTLTEDGLEITSVIPQSAGLADRLDFSSEHVAFGLKYNLTDYSSVRFLDYSMTGEENIDVNTTDIAVLDLAVNEYNAVVYDVWSYWIDVYADVLIKNNGTNTLNSIRLNRAQGWGICNEAYYSTEYYDLNLAPGDSMWIDAGYIGSNINPTPLVDDMFNFEMCLYSSHPNSLTDMNVPNDELCKNINIVYTGLEELANDDFTIYPNPAKEFINFTNRNYEATHFEIYNILGELISSGPIQKERLIDISTLKPGILFVKMLNRKGDPLGVSKVVKN